MSDIPNEAVDAAAEAMAEMWNQRLSEEDAPYTPSDFTCDARDILSAAAPIIRAQERHEINTQPEVVEAWYALVDHEAFTQCHAEEAPLLDSMLDRLSQLVEVEAAVTGQDSPRAAEQEAYDEGLREAARIAEAMRIIPEGLKENE